jgi:preprotein translocase subunit Sec63
LYIGRRLPEFAHRHAKVSFADVLGFYRESEKHRELLQARQEEILRMKKVIETLYEDIRLLRRQGRHAGSHRPNVDRLFKQLVMKYHPDRNAHRRFEAEEVMKDINQLYQKLAKT